MKPVESSTISHIGHKDGVLSVRFHSNPKVIYDYPNVTAEEHAAFMASDSKGSHHAKNFKGRPFTKRDI
jgi:hypothetical protein